MNADVGGKENGAMGYCYDPIAVAAATVDADADAVADNDQKDYNVDDKDVDKADDKVANIASSKTAKLQIYPNSRIPHLLLEMMPMPMPMPTSPLSNGINQFHHSGRGRMPALKSNLPSPHTNNGCNNNQQQQQHHHHYNQHHGQPHNGNHRHYMVEHVNSATTTPSELISTSQSAAARASRCPDKGALFAPAQSLSLKRYNNGKTDDIATTTITTTADNHLLLTISEPGKRASSVLSPLNNLSSKNQSRLQTIIAKPLPASFALPLSTSLSSTSTSTLISTSSPTSTSTSTLSLSHPKSVLFKSPYVSHGAVVLCKDEHKMQVTQDRDNVKMSLNTNAAATTTTTANARPDTLTASAVIGEGSVTSKIATTQTTNITTPRTPTKVAATVSSSATATASVSTQISSLPIFQNNSNKSKNNNNNTNIGHINYTYHHHHHNQHCWKQQQHQPLLASVQESKVLPKTPPVTPDSNSTYLEDDIDSLYSFATTTSGRSTMSCEHPYVARNGTTFSGRKMKYVVHCSNYAGQVGPDYLTPTQRAQRQIRRLKDLLFIARRDLEQKDSEILRLTREVVELRLFKASLSSPEERSASSDAVTVREAELKTSQDVSPIVDMVDDIGANNKNNSNSNSNSSCSTSPRHLLVSSRNSMMMPLCSEMQSSFADSGHFEDMTSSSVHSKDSYATHTNETLTSDGSKGTTADGGGGDERDADADTDADADACNAADNYEIQRQELIRMYEQRIEELIRTQDTASSEMKRSHNDKVEALLQKLAECNTRYADLVPSHEHAKERIRELEKQLEDLQRKLAEQEEKSNKVYLHMYQQEQDAEKIARADQALEIVHRTHHNRVSINELLHQLQSTQDELENIRGAECRNQSGSNHALLTAKEAISLWVLGARKTIYRRLLEAQKNRTHVDPEVTLQFLKSAIYYFLTDKENSQGHLQAIESILEFTEAEKRNINKAHSSK